MDKRSISTILEDTTRELGPVLQRLANNVHPSKNSIDNSEKFWYLCTPYSKYPGGLEVAYKKASEMLMYLEENNFFCYCPIVHSHTPAKYGSEGLSFNHAFWLNIDFKFIRISKGLIITKMEGWDKSYGIGEEIKYAKALGLPIYYTNFMSIPEELI